MMVANLLLLGSKAGLFDHYFRDYYMSKFFRVIFFFFGFVLAMCLLKCLNDINVIMGLQKFVNF